jgi:LemA protein
MVWWLLMTLVAMATVVGIGVILGVTNARLKTRCTVVKHAREGLELQLQRRQELIDSILDPIQRDGAFDLDSTDNVAFLARRARNTVKFTERCHFETALAESLQDLLNAVDNSPELSINEAYARPRQQLAEVEVDLRNAQRFYNDAVQQYNAILDFLPTRAIGAMFSFSHVDPAELVPACPAEAPPITSPIAAMPPMPSIVPAPKGRVAQVKKV